jgi:hypothetical protein
MVKEKDMTYRITDLLPMKLVLTIIAISPAIVASYISDERSMFYRFAIGAAVMTVALVAMAIGPVRNGKYPPDRFKLVSALLFIMWWGGLAGMYFFG